MHVLVQDHKHHALQLGRLARHLHELNQTVIWVDINPMTFAVHGAPALKCALNVNAAAHAQVSLSYFCMHLMSVICPRVSPMAHEVQRVYINMGTGPGKVASGRSVI